MEALDALTQAAAKREAALEDYRAAVFAALAAGHNQSTVATAAGTSRQAISQMVKRAQS